VRCHVSIPPASTDTDDASSPQHPDNTSGTLAAVTEADRGEVDGETFEVTSRSDVPGQYYFAWVSGRHSGYGFTVRTSDGSALRRDQVVSQIRTFLAQIDPQTGYIAD
jgi:hypothetical protein